MHKQRLSITVTQLQDMIGIRVRYQGVVCQVLEVLEEGPALVLEDLENHTLIQPDQHGEAHRRVPQTYTVQVLSVDSVEFHPAFLALDPLDSL